MYPGVFASKMPDRPAIIMAGSGRVMTYRELEDESIRLARFLRSNGLMPGDGVVLVSPNDPQCFVTYWAALRSGLYVTPLNFHLTPPEAAAVLNNCQPKALIVSSRCAELAECLAGAVEGVEIKLCFDGEVSGYDDYAVSLADASIEPLEDQPRGEDMLYSSGTTGGTPKGIRPALTGRQLGEDSTYLVDTFGRSYHFGEDSVYLSPAPLYHGGPLRFAIMTQMLGGTAIVLERFDAEAALKAIERFRCTHSQWVPTMFVRMLKLPEDVRKSYDVSSLQWAIHASAPCPIDVKSAMLDWWGPILEEYYASQESAGITMISSQEWIEHRGSVGRPVLGDVKVCDDLGRIVPAGEVGTIYYAREEMPFEYHRDPESTRAVQHPDHPTWTTPGDVGYVDEEGYVYLTDRKSFMIISGGVNIYPQEIEDQLVLHPALHDVAVVGLPDDDLGEVVTAFVCVAQGYEATDALSAEIMAHLGGTLAPYKLPRQLHFVDSLPRTPTGKLAKSRLAELIVG